MEKFSFEALKEIRFLLAQLDMIAKSKFKRSAASSLEFSGALSVERGCHRL